MAFKDTWRPRVDGVDDADSSAVNEIANELIKLEDNGIITPNDISSFGGLQYNKSSLGGLAILPANENDVRSKSDIFKPVPVEYMDFAISNGTHQEMSDYYDTSSFNTGSSMVGKQGQLPASYDAVKGYVDSEINNAIGVVLGGES